MRPDSHWRTCSQLVPLLSLALLIQCGERPQETEPDPGVEPPGDMTQAFVFPGGAKSPDGVDLQPLALDSRVGVNRAREFSPLTEDQRKALELLTTEFWETQESDKRLEILDEIESSFYGLEILGLVEDIIGLNDETLSTRAIELLDGNIDPSIIPLLEKALLATSGEIREIAASAGSQVRDDSLVGFFGKVFADASANVQISGLDSIDGQVEGRRVKILALALRSPLPEVQTSAINLIELTATRQSVEVLFDALDASDTNVRDEARFSLEFMLNQEFANAAEAREWWKVNRDQFDDDLAPAG